MTREEIIVEEINLFLRSKKRETMLKGMRYYEGKHDILERKRTAIGEGGRVQEIQNIPNNRVIDNLYRKMIMQKANYLLGKPFSIQTDNEKYADLLNGAFSRRFFKTLNAICIDSLNCGIGWAFVYYDSNGNISLRRLNPTEVVPIWKDEEHETLDFAIRFFDIDAYEGKEHRIMRVVEVFESDGMSRYELLNNELKPLQTGKENYISIDETGYNWSRIPLIPFKANAEETALIQHVKTLQDALNMLLSDFVNNMQEDCRNTILVLENCGGEELGSFRKNLSEYGAIKVSGEMDSRASVKTLRIEVDNENYKVILDIMKRSLIENAMGYDAKDDRIGGNANQMNIQSMYSDIELAANQMETEYQYSLESLVWFLDTHFANVRQGTFYDISVDFVFNRDMLMNETEIISNIRASVGLLSRQTLVAQHPWVKDADAEIKRLEDEERAAAEADADYQHEAHDAQAGEK
ncbi:MAG: phage portal protein [Oscillospiraceae bacterium]|nr:phage portal protein [Oscillospiraceae bacterium]